jgi:Ca2+-binding RTX toxin-like protein
LAGSNFPVAASIRFDPGEVPVSAIGGIEVVIGPANEDFVLFSLSGRGLTFPAVLGTDAQVLSGDDALDGGLADDRILGYAGDDRIGTGTAGNDTAGGGAGNDEVISLGFGRDVLSGGFGRDVLHGGLGRDLLFGNAGRDRLQGSGGADTMTGGAGADVFDFRASAFESASPGGLGRRRDVITDFDRGTDKINLDLAGEDGQYAFLGRGAFTGADQIRFVNEGANNVVILVNQDADLTAEFAILVEDISRISRADLIL